MKPPQYIRGCRFLGSQPMRVPDKLASDRHHTARAATAADRHRTFPGRAFILPPQNHRHPVVDVYDNLVRAGGNDHAGVKFLAVGRCPGVKQAGEGKGFSVPHGNSHRLFPPVHLLPLVEAVGRDYAAFTFKQLTKCWFLLQRFGSGVDHLVADLLVLCPRWNKALTQLAGSAAPAVSKNCRDRLTGGDIVPRAGIIYAHFSFLRLIISSCST